MTDLDKFQEKRKESIFQTIAGTFWRALEDLGHAMAGGKKSPAGVQGSSSASDQISVELDKFENAKINKSRP